MTEEIKLNAIAIILSFLIWLDIDILLTMRISKKTLKTKNEKFKEKAIANGTCISGFLVDKKSYCDDKNDSYYNLKYEYIVDGKKYYKRISVSKNENISNNIDIYYSSENPKKSIVEKEILIKKGFFYSFASVCIPFSIFIGLPVLTIILSIIIEKLF